MERVTGARTIEPRRTPWLMVLPALLIILAINIVPLVYSTILAFFQWNLTQAQVAPRFVGLDNFIRLLTRDPQFVTAAINTAIVVVATVAIQAVLGVAIALLPGEARAPVPAPTGAAPRREPLAPSRNS